METTIKLRICYLQDVLGNTYVGFKIAPYAIHDVLDKWHNDFSSVLNVDFKTMYDNRERRDGVNYHSTLFPVAEYQKSDIREAVQEYVGREYKFTMDGIGRVVDEAKGLETQFVVLTCSALDKLRSVLGLEKRDLHITLGFDKKDVFNKPKDASTVYLTF